MEVRVHHRRAHPSRLTSPDPAVCGPPAAQDQREDDRAEDDQPAPGHGDDHLGGGTGRRGRGRRDRAFLTDLDLPCQPRAGDLVRVVGPRRAGQGDGDRGGDGLGDQRGQLVRRRRVGIAEQAGPGGRAEGDGAGQVARPVVGDVEVEVDLQCRVVLGQPRGQVAERVRQLLRRGGRPCHLDGQPTVAVGASRDGPPLVRVPGGDRRFQVRGGVDGQGIQLREQLAVDGDDQRRGPGAVAFDGRPGRDVEAAAGQDRRRQQARPHARQQRMSRHGGLGTVETGESGAR